MTPGAEQRRCTDSTMNVMSNITIARFPIVLNFWYPECQIFGARNVCLSLILSRCVMCNTNLKPQHAVLWQLLNKPMWLKLKLTKHCVCTVCCSTIIRTAAGSQCRQQDLVCMVLTRYGKLIFVTIFVRFVLKPWDLLILGSKIVSFLVGLLEAQRFDWQLNCDIWRWQGQSIFQIL